MPIIVSILVFGGVVIAFDTIWSLLARQFRLRYSSLAWLSLIIYTLSGFIVGLSPENAPNKLLICALVGMAVSAINSTLGWWISATIGAGKPAPGQSIAKTIVTTILFGSLCGALGGVLTPLRDWVWAYGNM